MGLQGGQAGEADYLELGSWNVSCSMCGRKRKSSKVVQNWQGQYRCPWHNEIRQPQDFVRNVKDIMTVPFAQPENIVFVPIIAPFPLGISPNPIILTLFADDLITESGSNPLYTELPSFTDLTIETGYEGFANSTYPGWVVPTSFLWSWASGGVGITIASPTANATFLNAIAPGVHGVLQVLVTDNLGGQATATVSVHT